MEQEQINSSSKNDEEDIQSLRKGEYYANDVKAKSLVIDNMSQWDSTIVKNWLRLHVGGLDEEMMEKFYPEADKEERFNGQSLDALNEGSLKALGFEE